MTLGLALLSRRRRLRRCWCILLFAAVFSISLFCLLVKCLYDLLCFVEQWLIGFRCVPLTFTRKSRQNDFDADTTAASGSVEMEPTTTEGTDIVQDITESEHHIAEDNVDIAKSVSIAEVTTAPGNVKNLIKKFEIVEKTDTEKVLTSSAAVGYNGLNGSQTSLHVDQPNAGVVGQLVKRFDGSEKVPVLDDKPSLQVINKTSTMIHLIDRFNCAAV